MSTLSGIVQSAFDWTWHTSLQVSVLIVLILVLQRLLRRWLTPRLRYGLSLLVLCRLLLPVAPSSSLSLENLLAPTPQLAQSATPPTIAPRPIPGLARFVQTDSVSMGSALCIVWSCGLLFLTGLVVLRYCQWRRTIRTARQVSDTRLLQILDDVRQEMGIGREVKLASLPHLGSPAVFGFWRIHLLLPETALKLLCDQEWRLVFLHEMTHIRNGDTVLNAFLIAVQFLHWFNPLVWIGLNRLRADRELVCDAVVVERLEEAERLGYARVLLRLAEAISNGPRIFPSALPVISNASEIKTRVLMIKHHRKAGRTARYATVVCVLLLGFLTFTRAREGGAQTATDDTASRLSGRTQHDVENLVMHEFKKAGYSLPESVLDDLVQETIKNEFGDRATLIDTLETRGISYEKFRQQIEDRFRAQLSLKNIATNDQRALWFDWYLGNFLMSNPRVAFSGGTAPTSSGGPSKANPQEFSPGASPGTIIAPAASDQLITSGLRNALNAPAIGTLTGILTVGGETNVATNQTPSEQKVAAIEVKYVGPTTAEETEVRRSIRTQVGQTYMPAHVDDDVRSLYATGRFYNIHVSAQSSSKGIELVYSVQCNPRLAKVAFTGNSKFSNAQLQKLIRAKVGDVFNERKIFLDSQAVQTAYENAGYKGTGVKYSYQTDEQAGKASVTLEITERP